MGVIDEIASAGTEPSEPSTAPTGEYGIPQQIDHLANLYGLKKTSGRRSASQNQAAGGAKGSRHLSGLAGDYAGAPEAMQQFADHVEREYGSQVHELIYRDRFLKQGNRIAARDDHNDHVHVSWDAPTREMAGPPRPAVPAPRATYTPAPAAAPPPQPASSAGPKPTPAAVPLPALTLDNLYGPVARPAGTTAPSPAAAPPAAVSAPAAPPARELAGPPRPQASPPTPLAATSAPTKPAGKKPAPRELAGPPRPRGDAALRSELTKLEAESRRLSSQIARLQSDGVPGSDPRIQALVARIQGTGEALRPNAAPLPGTLNARALEIRRQLGEPVPQPEPKVKVTRYLYAGTGAPGVPVTQEVTPDEAAFLQNTPEARRQQIDILNRQRQAAYEQAPVPPSQKRKEPFRKLPYPPEHPFWYYLPRPTLTEKGLQWKGGNPEQAWSAVGEGVQALAGTFISGVLTGEGRNIETADATEARMRATGVSLPVPGSKEFDRHRSDLDAAIRLHQKFLQPEQNPRPDTVRSILSSPAYQQARKQLSPKAQEYARKYAVLELARGGGLADPNQGTAIEAGAVVDILLHRGLRGPLAKAEAAGEQLAAGLAGKEAAEAALERGIVGSLQAGGVKQLAKDAALRGLAEAPKGALHTGALEGYQAGMEGKLQDAPVRALQGTISGGLGSFLAGATLGKTPQASAMRRYVQSIGQEALEEGYQETLQAISRGVTDPAQLVNTFVGAAALGGVMAAGMGASGTTNELVRRRLQQQQDVYGPEVRRLVQQARLDYLSRQAAGATPETLAAAASGREAAAPPPASRVVDEIATAGTDQVSEVQPFGMRPEDAVRLGVAAAPAPTVTAPVETPVAPVPARPSVDEREAELWRTLQPGIAPVRRSPAPTPAPAEPAPLAEPAPAPASQAVPVSEDAVRKEFAAFQRQAAGLVRLAPTQARAKPGGETGPNGEWYEGGKWIATSPETVKGAFKKVRQAGEAANRRADAGVELEPGGTREVLPLGTSALVNQLPFGTYLMPGEGQRGYLGTVRFNEQVLARGVGGQGHTAEQADAIRARYAPLIDRWNRGERVIDLLREPQLATRDDLARYITVRQRIPDALLPVAETVLPGIDVRRWNWLVDRASENEAAPAATVAPAAPEMSPVSSPAATPPAPEAAPSRAAALAAEADSVQQTLLDDLAENGYGTPGEIRKRSGVSESSAAVVRALDALQRQGLVTYDENEGTYDLPRPTAPATNASAPVPAPVSAPAPAAKPSAPALAPTPTSGRPVVLQVNGEERTAELTPAQAQEWDAAETEYRRERGKLEAALKAAKVAKSGPVSATASVDPRLATMDALSKQLKALGIRHAARQREIAGLLTDREQAAAQKSAAALSVGKSVDVTLDDGRVMPGTVVGTPFGKVKVKFENGHVATHPRERVALAERVAPASAPAATPSAPPAAASTPAKPAPASTSRQSEPQAAPKSKAPDPSLPTLTRNGIVQPRTKSEQAAYEDGRRTRAQFGAGGNNAPRKLSPSERDAWTRGWDDEDIARMDTRRAELSAASATPALAEDSAPAKQDRFETAIAELAAKGANNQTFTTDTFLEDVAWLKKQMGNVNAGVNPEMMFRGIRIAGYLVETGTRQFTDYAAKMVELFGEGVRPRLKQWYEGVRNEPGFNTEGMSSREEVDTLAAEIGKPAATTATTATASESPEAPAAKAEPMPAPKSDAKPPAAAPAPAAALTSPTATREGGYIRLKFPAGQQPDSAPAELKKAGFVWLGSDTQWEADATSERWRLAQRYANAATAKTPPAEVPVRPAAKKSAEERLNAHGLNKSQEQYLIRELLGIRDSLPAIAPLDTTRTITDSRGNSNTKVHPVDYTSAARIKVPGDGTFLVASQEQVNALLASLKRKPGEGTAEKRQAALLKAQMRARDAAWREYPDGSLSVALSAPGFRLAGYREELEAVARRTGYRVEEIKAPETSWASGRAVADTEEVVALKFVPDDGSASEQAPAAVVGKADLRALGEHYRKEIADVAFTGAYWDTPVFKAVLAATQDLPQGTPPSVRINTALERHAEAVRQALAEGRIPQGTALETRLKRDYPELAAAGATPVPQANAKASAAEEPATPASWALAGYRGEPFNGYESSTNGMSHRGGAFLASRGYPAPTDAKAARGTAVRFTVPGGQVVVAFTGPKFEPTIRESTAPPPRQAIKPTTATDALPWAAGDAERQRKLAELEGRRFKSYSDELSMQILREQIASDPRKWAEGDGVGYRVGRGNAGQINRGFRVVRVDAEKKLALVRQVADTGLTSSGGDNDQIRDQWVDIADLVRDRKYDRPPNATKPDDRGVSKMAEQAKTEAAAEDATEPVAPAEEYSPARHKQVLQRIRAGEITAEELRAEYNRALAAETNIRAALNARTKEQLGIPPSETKPAGIDAIWRQMLQDFVPGGGLTWSPFQETFEAAVRRAVNKATDEQIRQAANERAARTEATRKTLTEPETYAEFQQFVYVRGADALTPEQRRRWDELQAEQARLLKRGDQERRATVSAVQGIADIPMEIVEGFHTKREEPIFIVTMGERVDGDTFKELAAKARQLGGNYATNSRWSKDPNGFNFRTREAAEKFLALREGSVSRAEEVTARQEARVETAAERLRGLADSLSERAEETLSADRKTNTARRAEMASGIENRARGDLAFAETLRNLAAAMDAGQVKHLDGIRAMTHVETLDTLLRQAHLAKVRTLPGRSQNEAWDAPATLDDIDYAAYPYPVVSASSLLRAAKSLEAMKGGKLLAARLRKSAAGAKDDLARFTSAVEVETLRDAAAKLGGTSGGYLASGLKDRLTDYDRLQRMGLETEAQLRAALREYLQYRGKKADEDPIKAAERALVGQNIGQDFFPTPKALAARVAELADIQPGMSVLEPSAGKGDLLDAVKAAQPEAQVEAVELSSTLADLLKAKGYPVVGQDFTQFAPKQQYDRIVMNPPFSNGADADHVRRAYDLLKPGGKLVAITGEGIFFRGDKKATEFRAWLQSVNGTSEKLPEGSFRDSDRSTGVNTRLVVVEKPAAVTLGTEPAASAVPNKAHAIPLSRVTTPAGALSAAATASRADTSVWYHQGDLGQLQFTAKVVVDGKPDPRAAEAQQTLDRLAAAKKDGWRLVNMRAGRLGTVWTLQRGKEILTRAGFAGSGAQQFQRPDLSDLTGPGFDNLATAQIRIAKAFNDWLQTLPEPQRDNRGVVSRKIGETPLGAWARIEDSGPGEVALRYYDRTEAPSFRYQITAPGDWDALRSYLAALAGKAAAIGGDRSLSQLVYDARDEAGIRPKRTADDTSDAKATAPAAAPANGTENAPEPVPVEQAFARQRELQRAYEALDTQMGILFRRKDRLRGELDRLREARRSSAAPPVNTKLKALEAEIEALDARREAAQAEIDAHTESEFQVKLADGTITDWQDVEGGKLYQEYLASLDDDAIPYAADGAVYQSAAQALRREGFRVTIQRTAAGEVAGMQARQVNATDAPLIDVTFGVDRHGNVEWTAEPRSIGDERHPSVRALQQALDGIDFDATPTAADQGQSAMNFSAPPEPAKPTAPKAAKTAGAMLRLAPYQRTTPAPNTEERTALKTQLEETQDRSRALYDERSKLEQKVRSTSSATVRQQAERKLEKVRAEEEASDTAAADVRRTLDRAQWEDVLEAPADYDEATRLVAEAKVKRDATWGFYGERLENEPNAKPVEALVDAEIARQEMPPAIRQYVLVNLWREARPNQLASLVTSFGNRELREQAVEAVKALTNLPKGERDAFVSRIANPYSFSDVTTDQKDAIAGLLKEAQDADVAAAQANARVAEQAQQAAQQAVIDRSRALSDEPPALKVTEAWRGNIAAQGPFKTDGKILLDTREVTKKGAKRAEKLSEKYDQGKRAGAERVATAFADYAEGATAPLELLGYEGATIHYAVRGTETQVSTVGQQVRLIEALTEPDEARFNPQRGIIAYFRDGKPVAVVTMLSPDASGYPRIDVGVARLAATEAKTLATLEQLAEENAPPAGSPSAEATAPAKLGRATLAALTELGAIRFARGDVRFLDWSAGLLAAAERAQGPAFAMQVRANLDRLWERARQHYGTPEFRDWVQADVPTLAEPLPEDARMVKAVQQGALPVRNREEAEQAYREVFRLTPEQAQDAAAVTDLVAQALAALRGTDTTEVYRSLPTVTLRDGKAVKGALAQETLSESAVPAPRALVEPVNEITDPEKLEALTRSMRAKGWQGRPLLVVSYGDPARPEWYQALTGSHRLMAAKQAGIDQIPVLAIHADRLTEAGYEASDLLGGEDAARSILQDLDAPDAMRLLDAEIRMNDAEATGGMLAQDAESAPTFFSYAQQVLARKMPRKATAADVMGLLKGQGVKPDELRWSGLDEWLQAKQSAGEPVTRDEALQFLQRSQVDIQEVLKGAQVSKPRPLREVMRELAEEEANDWNTWEDSLDPEGNYSREEWEALSRDERTDLALEAFRDYYHEKAGEILDAEKDAQNAPTRYEGYTAPGGENYRELLLTLPGNTYHSSHWHEPGVLAHVRFDERTDAEGRRVLHVAEIQSDLHQDGRKKGYFDPKTPWEVFDAQTGKTLGYYATEAEAAAATGTNPALDFWRSDDMQQQIQAGKVALAPFAKTWHELALRRMLRWAAENGFDRLTWDTGSTAAQRFDLARHADAVEYRRDGDRFDVVLVKNDRTVDRKALTSEELEAYVGKEVAQRIDSGVGEPVTDGTDGEEWKALRGINLVSGGEGMRGFYDSILPAYAKKYGKKWGAAVGETQVQAENSVYSVRDAIYGQDGDRVFLHIRDRRIGPEFPDLKSAAEWRTAHANEKVNFSSTIPAWGIDITPAMRESVLYEGQPLFQAPKGSILFLPEGRAIVRAFEQADVSTAIHELAGHRFIPQFLMEAGQAEDAGMRADADAFHRWLNLEPGSFLPLHERYVAGELSGVDKRRYVRAQEQIARGFERYLRDGEAPTVALKGLFQRFKDWLTAIYGAIIRPKSGLDVQLTPEARRFYARALNVTEANLPPATPTSEAGAGSSEAMPPRVRPAVAADTSLEGAAAGSRAGVAGSSSSSSRAAGSGPLGDYAASVNLDKLAISPEAREEIRALAAEMDGSLTQQRRGVRSQEVTDAAADALIRSGALTVRAAPGKAFNAEELRGLGKLFLRAQADYHDARETYDASQSEASRAALAEAKLRMDTLMLTYSGALTEAGRALNALRWMREAYTAELTEQQLQRLYAPAFSAAPQIRLSPANPKLAERNQFVPRAEGLDALRTLKRLRGEPVLFQSAVDPAAAHLATYGAMLVEHGINRRAQWETQMRGDVGDWLTDAQLETAWTAARDTLRSRINDTLTLNDRARQKLMRLRDQTLTPEQQVQLRKAQRNPAEFRAAVDAILPPEVLKGLNAAGNDPVKLTRFLAEQQQGTFTQHLTTAYKSLLTFRVGTHVRNVTSTALMIPLRTATEVLGATVEPAFARAQGRDRETTLRGALAGAAATFPAIKTGWAEFKHALQHGMTLEEAARLDYHGPELPGGLANPLNTNLRLQGATDALNKALIRNQAVWQYATDHALREGRKGADVMRRARALAMLDDGLSKSDRDLALGLHERAYDQAKYYTFNTDPEGWLKAAIDVRNKAGVVGHKLVPFVRTPGNVLIVAYDFSPLGLVSVAKKLQQGDVTAREAFSRVVAGSLLMSLLASLVRDEDITTAVPSNPAERDAFYSSGKQPYSLRVRGHWYSYGNLGPYTTLLAAVGGWKDEYWKRGQSVPAEQAMHAVRIAAEAFASQSFLTGLSAFGDLLLNFEEPNKATRYVGGELRSLLPGVVQETARATDRIIRQPKTVEDVVKTGVPGLSKTVPPRISATGEPSRRLGSPLNAYVPPLLPFAVVPAADALAPEDITEQDPVRKELARLRVTLPLVSDRALRVGNSEVKLTAAELQARREQQGQELMRYLRRVVESKHYRQLTDEAKQRELERIIQGINSRSLRQFKSRLLRGRGERMEPPTAKRP